VTRPRSRALGPSLAALLGIGLALVAARILTPAAPRRPRFTGTESGSLERRASELSALSTHLQQLAETEKAELARELHDELGGLLTAAKMDLSWLQSRVTDQSAVQQRLQQLGAVLDQAMDVKRRVVEELRPSLLDHFGLAVALRSYLEGLCGQAGLECDALIEVEEPVAADIAIGVFRIVQEALLNVVRHAHARHVRLELRGRSASYLLRLQDDGRGMDLSDSRVRFSHGLTGMRHRVWALGGRIALESAPGAGTAVEVVLPRSAPAAPAQAMP